jgi:hypothetical protein
VIDEDIFYHDTVGETMLISVKEFFVTAQNTSTFKLFHKGKEAGTISIDH